MTTIALIRHGATQWNGEGRVQGRVDTPLSPAGRHELRSLAIPDRQQGATWLASPLRRAVETAAILNGGATIEPRLIETHWGAWEGLMSVVTAQHAARITARGRAGLDFRPPHGEGPHDVRARLTDLFAELGAKGGAYVGVTHKGVIRAALSLAIGWDMIDKAPVKLSWRAFHLFGIAPDGTLSLIEPNIRLAPRSQAA